MISITSPFWKSGDPAQDHVLSIELLRNRWKITSWKSDGQLPKVCPIMNC
jgi:hypothetical protein